MNKELAGNNILMLNTFSQIKQFCKDYKLKFLILDEFNNHLKDHLFHICLNLYKTDENVLNFEEN